MYIGRLEVRKGTCGLLLAMSVHLFWAKISQTIGALGDPRWTPLRSLMSTNVFTFVQLWGEIGPKHRLEPPRLRLVPPPLGNPGSATEVGARFGVGASCFRNSRSTPVSDTIRYAT